MSTQNIPISKSVLCLESFVNHFKKNVFMII
jgi:hypothetical protein